MKTRMIFVGPPGAGKGSQAKVLAKQLNVPHISTGDMFRNHLKNMTNLGIAASKFTEKGLLVPDDVTNEIIKDRFNQVDVKKGFILDGYPRTIAQANYLDILLKDLNLPLEIVINITSPDETIIARITGRWSCPTCGAVYHMINNPPKVDHLCDNDGTPLIQRKDDREETVIKRIAVYKKETYPLIKYYHDKGLLVDVNGDDEIPNISKKIMEILNS